MAAIMIKNAPKKVHDWLARTAIENRRSMTQQALYCLELCMNGMSDHDMDFPEPMDIPGGKVAYSFIDSAKKAGRR